MTLPPCKWLMVWPCWQSRWQPSVLLKPDFHQHYSEHLLKIQISGSHCKGRVLWVFSGLALWLGKTGVLNFLVSSFQTLILCVWLFHSMYLFLSVSSTSLWSLSPSTLFCECVAYSECLEINGWSECTGMVIFWGLVLVCKDGRLNSRTSH